MKPLVAVPSCSWLLMVPVARIAAEASPDQGPAKAEPGISYGARVCAYALYFVSSPIEQEGQVRFASNDAGKVWPGGRLVLDYPREGSVGLDRDIVPVHLRKGTTPILLKITNNLRNWGFVFRLTDPHGRPLRNVKFSLSPE